MDLKKNKNMLKFFYNIINNFILVLNNINILQQVFLVLLLIILFIYCVLNSYTRLYLFKIFKKLFICLLFSMILNSFLNNDFNFCEGLSNTKKTLMFLSVGTVSALAGITYWVYRNHDNLYHDYRGTINENILQTKFIFLKIYGKSFLEAKGGIKSEFFHLDKMAMHVLWADSVCRIFSNIYYNRCHLSLKEWIAISYGFANLNQYYKSYFSNLTYLLNYRSKNPQIFECGYYYYSSNQEVKLVPNSLFYEQEIESLRIAELLKNLDNQLRTFGAPSNLYKNRKFFNDQLQVDARERDFFFAAFGGIDFKKYTEIEGATKFTFNMFPINPEKVINHSFAYIYPFFWVLEKTLGLPNPIPSDLFIANYQGKINLFYFNTFPEAFKITPQDLFNPYAFINPVNQAYPFKSKIQSYVCTSIKSFKNFCDAHVPKE